MNPTDQQKFFALCARGKPEELLPYLANDWQHVINFNGLSGFYIACSEGNLPTMKLLYDHGADIHAVNVGGLNALDAAAHAGNLENVQWLVSKGVAFHDGPEKFLWFAVKYPDVLQYGLQHGLCPDSVDKYQQSLLHIAMAYQNETSFFHLVDAGANIHVSNQSNTTLLMQAAYYSHAHILKFLLEKGVNQNACNERGESALMIAVQRNSRKCMTLLAKHGDYNMRQENGADVIMVSLYRFVENIRDSAILSAKKQQKAINEAKKYLNFIIDNIPDNYQFCIENTFNNALCTAWDIANKNTYFDQSNLIKLMQHINFSYEDHLRLIAASDVSKKEQLMSLLEKYALKIQLENSLSPSSVKVPRLKL